MALVVVAPVLLAGDPAFHRIDLHVYRAGGSAALSGHPLYAASFGPDLRPRLPFTYPPFAALLATPLAAVPFWLADLLWTAGSCLALAWLLRLAAAPLLERLAGRRVPGGRVLGRLGLPAPAAGLALLDLAALWTAPVVDHLSYGQVNLALAALVVADLAVRRRPGGLLARVPVGVGVGVAAAVKLVPAAFGLLLLAVAVLPAARAARREAARAAAWAAAAFLGCGLLAAAALPRDSREYWLHQLRSSDRIGANDYSSNQSLRAVALRAVGRRLTEGEATARARAAGVPDGVAIAHVAPTTAATAAWLLGALVVLAVGLARARRAWLADDRLTAVVLTALVASLVSPVTWTHHLVWLPPALLLLALARPAGAPGRGLLRSRAHTAAAAGLLVLLWARLPFLGGHWVDHGATGVARVAAELLRDAYALVCLALLVALPVRATAPSAPGTGTPAGPAGTPVTAPAEPASGALARS